MFATGEHATISTTVQQRSVQRHVRHSRKNTGIAAGSRCSTLSADDNVAKCRSRSYCRRVSSSWCLSIDRFAAFPCAARASPKVTYFPARSAPRASFVSNFMAHHSRRFDGRYEKEIAIARPHTCNRGTKYVEFIELCFVLGTRYCTLKRNLSWSRSP